MPVPYAAIAQAALGLGQSIFSGKNKAEKALEKFSDSYKPNTSILDFYNKAYNNYSANPYNSAAFGVRKNLIGRNLATGIAATQDRRSGIGSIGALVQNANDATNNAAVQAEQVQRQNLNQLQGATAMKAQEDFKPFEMKYNLLSAKAGGANATRGAGIQNTFGGLNNILNYQLAKKTYGEDDIDPLTGKKIFKGRSGG